MSVPFARTVCACKADVENCYRQPGYLGIEDLAALPSALGLRDLPPEFFRQGHATLGSSLTGGTALLVAVPTIVPALRAGRCVFLTPGERCMIHAAAPFGCAYFDVHQSKAEADARSLWMLLRIAGDEDYTRAALELLPKDVECE